MRTPYFLSSLFLTLLLVQQPALAERYTFDNNHSEIHFTVGHFAGTEDGTFKNFKGSLDFDEQNPERSKVKLTITASSIDTGNIKRDTHLQREDYFDTKRYPTITFQSVAFKKRGKNYVVTGPLTLHGVKKNITLQVRLARKDAQWAIDGDALTFKSAYELNRIEFGVVGGRPAVGRSVKIKLNIKAYQEI